MHIKVISIFAGQPSAFANDINCLPKLAKTRSARQFIEEAIHEESAIEKKDCI